VRDHDCDGRDCDGVIMMAWLRLRWARLRWRDCDGVVATAMGKIAMHARGRGGSG
jgi:hypothetical protein